MITVKITDKINSSNISITAYRAIKILKLLIEKPYSNSELIEHLKNDKITRKSTSDDTLRITINSLKAAGCEIARPSPANGYKYVLLKHPFNINITKTQVKLLVKIRQNFLKKKQWRKVLEINDLYDKISAFVKDEEISNLFAYKKPFVKVRPEIIKIFQNEDLIHKEILFTYNSTGKKEEIINVRTDSVFCNSDRIYILGWYYKRQCYGYFNAEKISEIHSINNISKFDINNDFAVALYKITRDACKTFVCSEDEKVVYKDEKYLLVESKIKSEFKIIQRLLSFGSDFELVKPDFLKEKLADKIEKMFLRYGQ